MCRFEKVKLFEMRSNRSPTMSAGTVTTDLGLAMDAMS